MVSVLPQQQGPVGPMNQTVPAAAAASAQLRLHRLSGAQFHALYTNLAMPPGDPLIRRVMPYFLQQQDILEVEAKASSNSISLAHDALTRMGQRRGVTLAQLVALLHQMPDAAQLLSSLGFAQGPPPAMAPQHQQPPQQQQMTGGVFQSLLPTSRSLQVDEGDTALFAVTLREQCASMASVTWHRELSNQVLCHGTQLRMKAVVPTDQGLYRCAVQLANQLSGSPRPSVIFSLKVRAQPPAPSPQPQPQPPVQVPKCSGPLPIDMQRSHKYALIVSCQRYKYMHPLGFGTTKELDQLEDRLGKLGYRILRLMDPSRMQLLSAIDRLGNILALLSETAPHLFLLLDGHGTIVNSGNGDGATTSACFLPIDAQQNQPSSFLRVEEDILKPLADCLPGSHVTSNGHGRGLGAGVAAANDSDTGLLLAVMDMCRSADSGGVRLGGDLGLSVRGSQIHRLHATSYGRGAAALVDSAKHNRQSFGVSALNMRLQECLCHEDQLRVDEFLNKVKMSIEELAKRYQEQLPELQSSGTRIRLSDLVLLTDPYSIFAANRLIAVAQPAWRKFALLIGASSYYGGDCGNLPCVPGELRKVAGSLQLLGFQTVVCCDWVSKDCRNAKSALLAVVKDFCELLKQAGASSDSESQPVQAVLLVDGHGELSVSGADPNSAGRNLFLLPDGDSVDIDADLARPLFDSLPRLQRSGRRLLLGFYDACRSADGLAPGAAPNLQSLENPDYYRLYTTGASQLALASSYYGSYGVRALLDCLRKACSSGRSELDHRESLRPCQLLSRIAEQVFSESHRALPGSTQLPNVQSTPGRLSLADLDEYSVENTDERLRLLEMAWQLRERHGLK